MNPGSHYWKVKHRRPQAPIPAPKKQAPTYEIAMVVCPRCGEHIRLKEMTDWLSQGNLRTMKEVM